MTEWLSLSPLRKEQATVAEGKVQSLRCCLCALLLPPQKGMLSHPLCVSASLQFSPTQHILYCSMTTQDLCLGIWPRPPHSCSQIAFTVRLFPFSTSLTTLHGECSCFCIFTSCFLSILPARTLVPFSKPPRVHSPQPYLLCPLLLTIYLTERMLVRALQRNRTNKIYLERDWF